MWIIETLFWFSLAVVAYTYAGYPLLLAAISKLRPQPPGAGKVPESVSVVIAARNEEANIARRCGEFLTAFINNNVQGELIIVSDGSTDRTAQAARAAADQVANGMPCHVIELAINAGKAAALSRGCAAAGNEIIIFADARQTWAENAITQLVRNFADPRVGAVSGELVLESQSGVMQGVSLYWKYEKWLRCRESEVWSMVGATGAISAVRRELFRPIPPGTILDDVYWPLRVAMQGYRVIHTRDAVAFDRLPEKARDEFRRKVRTLSGNFQLAALLPAALLPWRNRIFLQFVSHKLLRLAAPWLLLAMLALCATVPSSAYRALLAAQVLFYFLGVLGLSKTVGARLKPASAAASFLVLNAAAWMAFWVWIFGRSAKSWNQTTYAAQKTAITAPLDSLKIDSVKTEA